MKILVPCKRVPNPDLKLKIAGGAVELGDTTWQVNPFDEYAVEAALRLTEKSKGGERSGEVVVVSIGPKEAQVQLRTLLAMGADRAILVGGQVEFRVEAPQSEGKQGTDALAGALLFGPVGMIAGGLMSAAKGAVAGLVPTNHTVELNDGALDANLVARILKAVVLAEKPDMVVMGKQAVDGDDNQVGQLLAGYLGWPQATFLSSLIVAADGKSATVCREVDTGVEERRVRLPAVTTVDLRIIGKKAVRNEALSGPEAEWEDTQRLASLKGIMAAKKKELKEITAESLGVPGGMLVKTLRHENPPARKAGVKVGSVEELVAKLHTEAKVI